MNPEIAIQLSAVVKLHMDAGKSSQNRISTT